MFAAFSILFGIGGAFFFFGVIGRLARSLVRIRGGDLEALYREVEATPWYKLRADSVRHQATINYTLLPAKYSTGFMAIGSACLVAAACLAVVGW